MSEATPHTCVSAVGEQPMLGLHTSVLHIGRRIRGVLVVAAGRRNVDVSVSHRLPFVESRTLRSQSAEPPRPDFRDSKPEGQTEVAELGRCSRVRGVRASLQRLLEPSPTNRNEAMRN
eukprot:3147-Rhodomonas_salina.2